MLDAEIYPLDTFCTLPHFTALEEVFRYSSHTVVTRLSQPCDKVVTTMSTIDKVVTTLWIGCHVKLRLSSLCYNLVCRLSQVSVTRSQP